jgi:glycosyltransferase involved in cell wall biosynthesis
MASYNAGRFIGHAIEGLLAQTFREFELIIVDDGSIDQTPYIIRQYARADPRIRAFHNGANRGLVFTRNRMLQESRASLVGIADADDVSYPKRLEKQFNLLQRRPEVGVVGSTVEFIDEHGDESSGLQFYTEDRHIRFFLLLGPCLWNPATMYRRDLMFQAGGYREGFERGAEDYDLWGRLAKKTRFAVLTEALVGYRKHAGSTTATEKSRNQENVLRVSAGLLSEYLSKTVEIAEVAELFRFRMRTATSVGGCALAAGLLRDLWREARERESADTLQLFREHIANPIWTQAQYQVYNDRALSLRLALRAAFLSPSVMATRGWFAYGCRWLAPSPLRAWIKRVSGTRGASLA